MAKIKIQNQPVGPFPTVLAGVDVNGKPNYTTIGACGVVCQDPVLYISLKSSHYSTAGVKENGFFSVNIPSTGLIQQTDYCGSVSGRSVDKSTVFTSFYDELGRAPLIRECPLNFLCKVIQDIPVFEFDMFLGQIVAVYADESCLNDGRPDALKMDPIIMSGGAYLNLGQRIGAAFQTGKGYRNPAAG
ncbi:MAG: flavin reductase family protein [Anaerolineaceae bacterium]|nr:flavin reductase family protein [Anaerolineaceae bacterium]